MAETDASTNTETSKDYEKLASYIVPIPKRKEIGKRIGESVGRPEEWRKRLERAGIRKRFWPCRFDLMEKYVIPESVQDAFRRARQYAEHFDKYARRGVGVIFIGPVGTMKTSMAAAVAQHAMAHGKSAFFIPMAELFDTLITMGKQRDHAEFLAFENRLKSTSLLILDDLGTEYPGDWIRNKVDAIISNRYNRMMPVIITTNLVPGELSGRYQERVYDRLKGSSLVITVAADSQRRAPKEITTSIS